MSLLNQSHNDSFFTVDISDDLDVVVFNMNLKGIIIFLKMIESHATLVLNKNNLLNIYQIKKYNPVHTIILNQNLAEDLDNNLVVNYLHSTNELFIFFNIKSLDRLKNSLISLKKSLELNKTEDISYMADEWGGNGLFNKKLIDNSSVIFHLRLYGVV